MLRTSGHKCVSLSELQFKANINSHCPELFSSFCSDTSFALPLVRAVFSSIFICLLRTANPKMHRKKERVLRPNVRLKYTVLNAEVLYILHAPLPPHIWYPHLRHVESIIAPKYMGAGIPASVRVASVWIPRASDLSSGLIHLTSSTKPGVPPREMIKELSTDRARKYGKILSQLSPRGHWPRVAVKFPGRLSASAKHLQFSKTVFLPEPVDKAHPAKQGET